MKWSKEQFPKPQLHSLANRLFKGLFRPGEEVCKKSSVRSADIPVIIPTFNNVTYARNMVQQLHDRKINNIAIIDNGSTYGPMLEFLSSPGVGVKVFFGKKNLGPRHIFLDDLCLTLLPTYFCLTDPDLGLNSDMPSTFLQELVEMTDAFKVGKAGLALQIDDRASLRQEQFLIAGRHYKIWEWEQQFWECPIGKTTAGDQI